ncbi:queuine tRNA-ribosyltransferase [Thermonema lapsum]|uniref:Queuine tRNA-ribosyltransferase n=2 Tax=Thermonema lapsum TaxID=28195 RepID=A0A846MQI1_9BACT|nr:queuine tRNA-ribosyltransferase [Thermonema lapsum]
MPVCLVKAISRFCLFSTLAINQEYIESMQFEVIAQDPKSKARAGKITTPHGEILTPIFMPVGTAGTVKAVHQRELENDIKAQIILGNTYHLYLRPGIELLKKAGGLHRFNGWKRPILTDSGGYQVYSLTENRQITEEGVFFKSHIDGSKHFFTPEKVMDIERAIGADIIMALDECTPYPCDYAYAKQSMEMTHRWLKRCIRRIEETEPLYGYEQTLFPIVQGSVYKDLRQASAEFVAACECDGNAIGGLSVGEPAELMYEMTELVCDLLPKDKPRYLMGVGTPANLLECIALGVDMFDCVMPTRNARNGMLFTTQGIINIRNKKWQEDFSPIDEPLGGYVSTFYSKAYLRHLIMNKEILGAQIASVHNLTFYLWLVNQAREHILAGDFYEWKKQILPIVSQRL